VVEAEAEVERMPLARRSTTKSRHVDRSNSLFDRKNEELFQGMVATILGGWKAAAEDMHRLLGGALRRISAAGKRHLGGRIMAWRMGSWSS
jgi:hypothetical protein